MLRQQTFLNRYLLIAYANAEVCAESHSSSAANAGVVTMEYTRLIESPKEWGKVIHIIPNSSSQLLEMSMRLEIWAYFVCGAGIPHLLAPSLKRRAG